MQIADYVPTLTKIMLSSASSILQSVYFSQIHGQKAHVLPVFARHFWYGMTVYVDCNCTICYGVLHRFHYQLYIEKENRFYMHVLKILKILDARPGFIIKFLKRSLIVNFI